MLNSVNNLRLSNIPGLYDRRLIRSSIESMIGVALDAGPEPYSNHIGIKFKYDTDEYKAILHVQNNFATLISINNTKNVIARVGKYRIPLSCSDSHRLLDKAIMNIEQWSASDMQACEVSNEY